MAQKTFLIVGSAWLGAATAYRLLERFRLALITLLEKEAVVRAQAMKSVGL